MKKPQLLPPPLPERRYGALEAGKNLSVLSALPGSHPCPGCRERGLLFVCHAFRDGAAGQVVELCRACALRQAGGEDGVYVRTGPVRQQWSTNARLKGRG